MNTNTPNKHFGFSLSLVAAALLAGCGGGGGQPSTPVPGNDAVNQLADVATGAAKQGAQTAKKAIGTHEGGVDGSGNGKQTTGPDGGKQGAQTTGPDGGNQAEQTTAPDGGKQGGQSTALGGGNQAAQTTGPDDGNQAEQTTAPDGGKHGGQTTGLDDGNQGGQSTAPDDGKQSKPSVGNADDNANTLSAGNDAGNTKTPLNGTAGGKQKTPSKGTGGSTKKAPSNGTGAGNATVQSGSDDKAAKSRPVRPEFRVDLHGKAVTAVMPLATAEMLYPKRKKAPPVAVPLANALMQVVVHDPEYAARLARANSPLTRVRSSAGKKLSVNIFHEFYSNYAEKTANFTEIQRNMFSVLGELAPFKPHSLQDRNLVQELGLAVGHGGLGLPISALGDFENGKQDANQTAAYLASSVVVMLEQLNNLSHDAQILINNREPSPGTQQVKAVKRAFVLAHPLTFSYIPEPDRIESFVLLTDRGSYVTFINEPADDGTSHWTMAANDQATPLQVGATPEQQVEIVEAAIKQLLLSETWDVLPGIVMVVYRL